MPRLSPKNATYMGIDTGKNGGLAAIVDGSPEAVHMPVTERDVWDWFDRWNPEHGPLVAVIEKVGGYIPGSKGNIGSAMFTFGLNYGLLRMALTAADIPWEEVTPQRWQKAIGISKRKGEEKRAYKQRLRAKAQQLFPKMNVTLATADALLIASYCQRKARGLL